MEAWTGSESKNRNYVYDNNLLFLGISGHPLMKDLSPDVEATNSPWSSHLDAKGPGCSRFVWHSQSYYTRHQDKL